MTMALVIGRFSPTVLSVREHIKSMASSAAEIDILRLLGKKWVLFLLKELSAGPLRFNELARDRRMSPNTLRNRLRDMEGAALVTRTVVDSLRPWVEYSLSQEGAALSEIVGMLDDWQRRRGEVRAGHRLGVAVVQDGGDGID